MSEEIVIAPNIPMKIMVVCGHCFAHNSDNAMIEYNFRDKKVYYICPSCKKTNTMGHDPGQKPPLPKAKLSR